MKNLEAYYEFYDEGCAKDSPVMLFLPGMGAGAAMFRPALSYFMPDYRVLLINNPGINGTSVTQGLQVRQIGRLVLMILNELGLRRVHILGHSMGGFTAQWLLINAPSRVENAVLVSTSYGGPQNRADAHRLATGSAEQNPFRYRKGFAKEHFKLLVGEKFHRDKPDLYTYWRDFYIDQRPGKDVMAAHLTCGGTFSAYGQLGRVAAPVLVVHGLADRVVGPEGGQKLAQQFRFNRFWGLPEVGHFPMWEMEGFYTRLRDWLQGSPVGESLAYRPGTSKDWASELTHWWGKFIK